MREGCVSCDCIDGNNTFWQLSATVDFVVVGGWPMTFTTSSGVVEWLATGENTILACDAYVEDVTHLGTKGKKDEK